jgi:hypothetical protein
MNQETPASGDRVEKVVRAPEGAAIAGEADVLIWIARQSASAFTLGVEDGAAIAIGSVHSYSSEKFCSAEF